jgi:N-acetylated-alpha-linked acidic dipeptidase
MVPSVRRSAVLLFSTFACTAALAAGVDRPPVLFGFTAADSAAQQALERRFDGALNPAELSSWLKNLSSEANHVGAPHDKVNAEFVRDQFQQWGWDAKI